MHELRRRPAALRRPAGGNGLSRRKLLKAGAIGALSTAAGFGKAAAAAPGRFPEGFRWGISTSSYQIEGRGDRTADCIWDTFARRPGAISDRSNAEIACDSYHRFQEDVALVAGAGLKAYRYSISWPRVMPQGSGRVDPRGLDYYSRLTDRLLEAGIEPWVCLFHWDLPQALQDRGGWTSRAIADYFADYAQLMARHLGDRVGHWVMLNEAAVHAIMGHGSGEFAPGLKSEAAMYAAMHHQNLAQGRALAALRAVGGERFRLGTVMSLQPVRPGGGRAENAAAAALWDALWNRAFLDPLFHGRYPPLIARSLEKLIEPGDLATIRQKVDFLGVNYYGPVYRRVAAGGFLGGNWGAPPADMPRTAMGWPIDPAALSDLLLELRDRYGDPVLYITENGAAFHEEPTAGRVADTQRIAYLRDHILVCHRAIAQGARLRGYFVWTLMDNFEWTHGYTAHFGLASVDRATLKRTPKESYDWFAKIAASNAI
ncbi:MAG TPA: GH1 family beta-glucosidase [Stellaceae bacterium]|nr:GH1 family beta-glucosidase [Stellaceae bacterium]